MKKDKLLAKIDKLNQEDRCLKVVVTIVKLPSGALEVIVNTDNLNDKLNYIINAYDDDLKLKSNQDIAIVDYLIF